MAPQCEQPGCTGQVEDGYCNICGAPPSAAEGFASPAAAAASGAGLADTPSARTSSASLASVPLGSARSAGTRPTRRTVSTRTRGARLGAGLTTVPTLPEVDPSKAVMKDPMVPENRRFCSSCGQAVGRGRDGQPGRTEGFCPQDRTPFSFSPKLVPGELVGGQYLVQGCLAHGGLGWIYLAKDRNVSDRWVVLKGLLNSGDPDALTAAIAERQFLAQVEHPLIVEIYNFVQHGEAGYIVMEYVGGVSLKGLLKQRMEANGGTVDPLPVDQVLAYLIEILPAFAYLHEHGLIFCDFKPENVIQVGDALKLIDLGGVRRAEDETSTIYGTRGYQAPEVEAVGPSVASDLYTIGRTLLSLAHDFRGNTTTYVTSLPPVADVPVFAANDSLYRLVAKACAPDPADRFGSADELRVQLTGVLREVVAAQRPEQAARHSWSSELFRAPAIEGDTLDWTGLPGLRVDPADPAAGWLATVNLDDPQSLVQALSKAPQFTTEVGLACAWAGIRAGEVKLAREQIDRLLELDPWEWRAVWMSGLLALATGDNAAAQAAFNAVYGQVPGELAPKLALALACEQGGRDELAETLYLTCLRTDANYTAAAAFGLARIRAQRCRTAKSELAPAVAALEMVPPTSRTYLAARARRADLLVEFGSGLGDLSAALAGLESVSLAPAEQARLKVNVLKAALDRVCEAGDQPGVTVGGVPAAQENLRDELESAYRALAATVEDPVQRIDLVDRANAVRQWSLR